MRCLLVEHDDGLVLIDTGRREQGDAKFHDIYGIENARRGRPHVRSRTALAPLGFAPEDVRLVINTHLHFDHAGGNTYRDADGRRCAPTFPNARYVVQSGEHALRDAHERAHGGELLPAELRAARSTPGGSTLVDGRAGDRCRGSATLPTPGTRRITRAC